MTRISQRRQPGQATSASLVRFTQCAFTVLLLTGQAAFVQAAPEGATDVVELRQGFVINSIGRYGRNPFHIDPIEALIVQGRWNPPAAGDSIAGPDGTART